MIKFPKYRLVSKFQAFNYFIWLVRAERSSLLNRQKRRKSNTNCSKVVFKQTNCQASTQYWRKQVDQVQKSPSHNGHTSLLSESNSVSQKQINLYVYLYLFSSRAEYLNKTGKKKQTEQKEVEWACWPCFEAICSRFLGIPITYSTWSQTWRELREPEKISSCQMLSLHRFYQARVHPSKMTIPESIICRVTTIHMGCHSVAWWIKYDNIKPDNLPKKTSTVVQHPRYHPISPVHQISHNIHTVPASLAEFGQPWKLARAQRRLAINAYNGMQACVRMDNTTCGKWT